MTQKLYRQDGDGIRVIDGRKAWGVDVPAYVYDIWVPLIGIDPVGIYGFLCRLAMGGKVSRLGIKKLAHVCHKGDVTFVKLTVLLRDCGFIKIKTPKEDERKRGVSTIYTVLDPPRDISLETINLYTGGNPDLYQPIAWWFIEDDDPDNLEDQEVEIPAEENQEIGVSLIGDTVGVSLVGDTVSPTGDTVSPNDDNSIDPLLDPLLDPVKDGSDFSERKIASTESPSEEPVPGNNGSESAGTEKTGSPAATGKRSTMTGADLRAEIARRQAGVAGKANANAEERTIDMRHRKDQKPAAGELPKIAQLVVRILTGAGVAPNRCKITSNQVDALTKINVQLKAKGGEMPFTVAELYDKYPVEFEAWTATIPAALKDGQNRHLTPGAVIDLMRGYDWYGIGFKAYLNARGDFSLPEGPSSDVPARDFVKAQQDSIYTTPDRILSEDEGNDQ